MSSAAASPLQVRDHARAMSGGAFVRDAIASLTLREAAYFLFTGLAIAAINGISGFEMLQKTGAPVGLVNAVLFPLLVGPFVMVGWVLADRAEHSAWSRPKRQALALAVSSVVAVVAVNALLHALGQAMPLEFKMEGKQYVIPAWSIYVEAWMHTAIYSALTITVLEFRRRRERSHQVLEAARTEQAQLSRQVLESRLAAMQAQVEPQFLFDSLVDVQATYDRDAGVGAEVMDRLINYLRVALPRLRERGSTVQAEAELLAAFIGVVAARHGGRPAVHFVVSPEAAAARFYPMLLLPLVQRSIRRVARERSDVPDRIELVSKRHGNELGVLLRIDAPGQCAEDAELERVRERLAGLYAERAQLTCAEPQPGVSEFVLRVPL